jgi:hypothetical protein
VSRPAVTILTDPVPTGSDLIPEVARICGRLARNALRPRTFSNDRRYRGHFAVTRSLVEGLSRIGASFNYNPRRLDQLSGSVVVLAGVRTLRQAIRLKRAGRIARLFAGPNIVIFASDHESLLAAPEVDCVIVPSDLVIEHYVEDCPSLRNRSFVWPAGVDTEFWRPMHGDRRRILVFEKQNKGPVGPVDPYVAYLRRAGYQVSVLQYGRYTHTQYRDLLRDSQLMIGFVRDESQGIAWAEAWAMDVPTMIWRNTRNTDRGRPYRCSTAPYLNAQNGLFFDDLGDFKEKFALWERTRAVFTPRNWTLDNMSDEVSARLLYQRVSAC